ncbi:MAG: radical SAM protein [Deltaproteobacteria bacterium]|nr:radical SAM protein [Deltaproteobacteria bacterium]MBW2308792.1 radical SAM protein [Deltaproteobacteria bacterium]
MIAFGPVPSRRLGRSLGINNIPPKVCTYSCVYCQVGRTKTMQVERRWFYPPEEILKDVRKKVERARQFEEPIDYLSFVPDGEPFLDINLGREIESLRSLGVKIAVITNASLIWRDDVKEELAKVDWVSLKVDSTRGDVWHRINRPHRTLSLSSIMDGMVEFARIFKGKLVTETMLIEGVNDGDDHVRKIADFLARLRPARAYVSIPTRPPAEKWVRPPGEEVINRAYHILDKSVDHVEYLIGYEGNAFACTGNVTEDLLAITSVHPMREEAVSRFLEKANDDWTTVRRLIAQGIFMEIEHEGRKFYMRKIASKKD